MFYSHDLVFFADYRGRTVGGSFNYCYLYLRNYVCRSCGNTKRDL